MATSSKPSRKKHKPNNPMPLSFSIESIMKSSSAPEPSSQAAIESSSSSSSSIISSPNNSPRNTPPATYTSHQLLHTSSHSNINNSNQGVNCCTTTTTASPRLTAEQSVKCKLVNNNNNNKDTWDRFRPSNTEMFNGTTNTRKRTYPADHYDDDDDDEEDDEEENELVSVENNSTPTPNTSSSSSHHVHNSNSNSNNINNNNININNSTQEVICCTSPRLEPVMCTLDNKDMWDKFHSLNTEMIITKTGRRMFPVVKVQFHKLDPNARYAVSLSIHPKDAKRYRYAYHKSCWQVAGKADPAPEPRLYPHPDSPFNGDLLMRQVISFEKVKLTNNEMDKSGHIILNSMHKYEPRVHLIELKSPPLVPQSPITTMNHPHHHNNTTTTLPNRSSSTSSSSSSHLNNDYNNRHHQQQSQQSQQMDVEGYKTFRFEETVFTAVTAYQNQLITKMKIDKNPFAKGFRDSSRLSDLDRNDPFDYMGPLGPGGAAAVSRFMNPNGMPSLPLGPGGLPGSLEAAAAASHMDAYQLLANNPWYSAAALVSAANGAASAGANAAACSTAQAAQLQATQMWLAAFSACLNNTETHEPEAGH